MASEIHKGNTTSYATTDELLRSQRQFSQRVDFRSLKWPAAEQLCRYTVQESIYNWLSSSIRDRPWPQYDARFLKELAKRIEQAATSSPAGGATGEDDDGDLFDPLFDLCAGAVASAVDMNDAATQAGAAQVDTIVSYSPPFVPGSTGATGPSTRELYITERPLLLAGSGCTGFRTWEACLHLASVLLRSDFSLSGKTVLELGAGTGLLGLAAVAWGGAARTIFTDGDVEAVTRLKSLAEMNHVSETTDAGVYRWGDTWQGTVVGDHMKRGEIDVVLAADVVNSKSPRRRYQADWDNNRPMIPQQFPRLFPLCMGFSLPDHQLK